MDSSITIDLIVTMSREDYAALDAVTRAARDVDFRNLARITFGGLELSWWEWAIKSHAFWLAWRSIIKKPSAIRIHKRARYMQINYTPEIHRYHFQPKKYD